MKLYDLIMWDPEGADAQDIVVKKHEAQDFNTHTQLIVHSSQEAIFYKDGRDLDLFEAGKYTLTTDKMPMLSKLMNKTTGGVEQFHSEVFFINKLSFPDLKWGTPDPVLVTDPLEGVQLHVRAHGFFGARIKDSRKLLRKIVGTQAVYTKEEFRQKLRAELIKRVVAMLTTVIELQNVNIYKINAYLIQLSDEMQKQLTPFFDDFGIELFNFSFNMISPLEEDLKAANESRIAARKMDLESEALARKRAREGYSYQAETAREVLTNAAQNNGTAGGLMGAGMGLGMGFGVGGAMGGAMGALGQQLNFNPQGAAPAGGMAAPVAEEKVPCPKCGAMVKKGAKFCAECGAPIPRDDVVICPKCKAELPKGTKFCFECGYKLITTCVSCGKELAPGAKFCPECGTKQPDGEEK